MKKKNMHSASGDGEKSDKKQTYLKGVRARANRRRADMATTNRGGVELWWQRYLGMDKRKEKGRKENFQVSKKSEKKKKVYRPLSVRAKRRVTMRTKKKTKAGGAEKRQ